MTTERLFPSGAWRVSDIVDGYLVERVYMGWTKREAMAAFSHEIRAKKATFKKGVSL